MPCAGVFTPLPHDARLPILGATAPTYTADGAWESGYYASASTGVRANPWQVSAIVLGDGDEVFITDEFWVPAGTWTPGVTEKILWLGSASSPLAGSQANSLSIEGQVSAASFRAVYYDAAGTAHATGYWVPTVDTLYVLGMGVKRYQSAGNWVVDVTLYDVAGVTNGGTPIALATLTADVISGADKTVTFSDGGAVPVAWAYSGLPFNFGKGGVASLRWGVGKCNASAAVVLRSGDAWTQADVDAVSASILDPDGAGGDRIYAVALITVYDTSASGDGWPTTTAVIDVRLPNSDGSPLQWTPSAGADHYALADDAFGSYDATDYLSSAAIGNVDQYGYPALSLAGKTVLGVGQLLNYANATNGIEFGGATFRIANKAYIFTDKAPTSAPPEPPAPDVPVQVLGGKGPVLRPRYDHILNTRPGDVGDQVRRIQRIDETLRRVTRNEREAVPA